MAAGTGRSPEGPAEIYQVLRLQALTVSPETAGIGPSEALPRVFGVIMDMAYPAGTATLAVMADGTTSLCARLAAQDLPNGASPAMPPPATTKATTQPASRTTGHHHSPSKPAPTPSTR